jgi:hypothetical protein
MTYRADLSCQIKCISETDSKHDWALGKTTDAPDYTVTTPYDVSVIPTPSSGVWTATAATLSGGGTVLPVINVTGASDWPGATGIVVKVKLNSGGDWLTSEVISPNATAHQIRGLKPETEYVVGVSYLGINNQEGSPRSLAFVTTAALAAGTAASVPWTGVTDPSGNRPDDNADVTSANTAAAIAGQAATATSSDFSAVTGATKPANNATVGAQSGTNLYRTDGTTVLSQAEIRTAEGTAAAITGQAATATSSDFSVVTGATKPANNATVGAQSGTNLYRTDGTTVLSQAEIRTAEGTAASISGQGTLATVNAADFSTQVTGGTKPANNATVGAVSGTNLYRTDGSTVMTQAEVRTAEGTASAITGQGVLDTLSTADTAQIADNATFIDNKFSVDGSINVGWGNEYEFGSVTTTVAGGTVQIFLNGDFSASSLSTGGNLELVFQRVRSGTTTDLATYVFNKSGAGNVAERPKLFISRASSVLSGDTYKAIMRVTGGTPGGASLIDTDCIITHLKR